MSKHDVEDESVYALSRRLQLMRWNEDLLAQRLVDARARRADLERRLAKLVAAPISRVDDPPTQPALAPTEGGEIVPEVFSSEG